MVSALQICKKSKSFICNKLKDRGWSEYDIRRGIHLNYNNRNIIINKYLNDQQKKHQFEVQRAK